MTFNPSDALEALTMARRVNVTGNAGAGKSTLSRALGPQLGLPVVHLDPLIWDTGWNKISEETRSESISAAASQPQWIIDGVSTEVRQKADVVVFIDLPTLTALFRVLRRAAILRNRSRPELGEGFPELGALRPAVRLARRFNRHIRPAILDDRKASPQFIHLTSSTQVEMLLRAFEQRRSR
jgi:adenylate kinase family enzyme